MSIIYKKLFSKLKETFEVSTTVAPVKIINNNNVIEVAIGNKFYVALLSGGTIYSWGDNPNIPYNIINNLTNILSVSCGENHLIILDNTGQVSAYGDNTFRQLNIVQGLSNVIAISANNNYSLALINTGKVVGWGENNYGQLNIPFNLINVIKISAGYTHCLALDSNKVVTGWGSNSNKQLIIPNFNYDFNYIDISAGDGFSLLLKNDTKVSLIGDNKNGLLNVPADLSNVISISAGSSHALALNNNNRIIAWGNNNNNQLNVAQNLYNVISISAGFNESVAIDKFTQPTSTSTTSSTTTTTTQAPTTPTTPKPTTSSTTISTKITTSSTSISPITNAVVTSSFPGVIVYIFEFNGIKYVKNTDFNPPLPNEENITIIFYPKPLIITNGKQWTLNIPELIDNKRILAVAMYGGVVGVPISSLNADIPYNSDTTIQMTINIPKSLKRIQAHAFKNITNGSNNIINLPEGLERIGTKCLSGYKMMSIIIPSTVWAIYDSAFENTDLESITYLGSSNLTNTTNFWSNVFSTIKTLTNPIIPTLYLNNACIQASTALQIHVNATTTWNGVYIRRII
jgi:alpha-tubulin suppressor-like RCC1 family protein